ncbi:MAG: hypothetical protein GY787_05410 [Alteromonadales bacterium]|nr:hypothetical protein [Alteromonadales bacterium]
MAHYAFLNNDHTTESLREELSVLSSEMGNLTSIEEPTEEDTVAIEAKQAEIDAKQQEIDNCLCIVTGVITGVLETYEKSARDETIEQEISDLEDSRTGKTKEEITAIDSDIQAKLEELHALPPEEIDNTIYWEGYYGKGGLCKRCSYNTYEGEHLLGGTPFRKNYPAVGYIYDPVRDAFYAPQPFESWIFNEDKCTWECPVVYPEQDEENPILYYWKEDTTEWVDYEYYSEPLYSIQPYPSWTWNVNTGIWDSPVELPDKENSYLWNEEFKNWVSIG